MRWTSDKIPQGFPKLVYGFGPISWRVPCISDGRYLVFLCLYGFPVNFDGSLWLSHVFLWSLVAFPWLSHDIRRPLCEGVTACGVSSRSLLHCHAVTPPYLPGRPQTPPPGGGVPGGPGRPGGVAGGVRGDTGPSIFPWRAVLPLERLQVWRFRRQNYAQVQVPVWGRLHFLCLSGRLL